MCLRFREPLQGGLNGGRAGCRTEDQTSWEGWGLGVDADGGVVVGGRVAIKQVPRPLREGCRPLREGWVWMRMEEWWREGMGCRRVGDGKEEQG